MLRMLSDAEHHPPYPDKFILGVVVVITLYCYARLLTRQLFIWCVYDSVRYMSLHAHGATCTVPERHRLSFIKPYWHRGATTVLFVKMSKYDIQFMRTQQYMAKFSDVVL